MKYFIHLSYKGTNYHGWQWQPMYPSVQGTLEVALEKMLGYKVSCSGCGRTDAGVHASQYFCHIKVTNVFEYDPVFRLNKILPEDISILDLIPVHWEAHAQKDAISRTYTYRIHTIKDALRSGLSAYYPKENLDLDLMNRALEILTRYRDFRAMCRRPSQYKTTICDLSAADLIIENGTKEFRFEFTANRFLMGMVRILVAQILEVGYGRGSLEQFENYFKTGYPPVHSKAAYPQGLYLSSVKYGYLDGC